MKPSKQSISPGPVALGVLLAILIAYLDSYVATTATNSASNEVNGREQEPNKAFFQRPGVRVSEILRARGYLAEEQSFVTDDGYVLGITRGLNPLIGPKRRQNLRRQPLLFIHGTLVDANSFVMNSFDIEQPKDFSGLDADQVSESKLIQLFNDEPSAKSLAFFALNFGHEVWFLHRRGSPLSQKRIDSPANKPKPPTVMQKYLASIEAHFGRDELANELNRNWRNRRSVSQTTITTDWFNSTAGDEMATRNNSSRHRRASELNNHERSSSQATTKKDHTRVVEAVEAAPAALADYGNLGIDIKITLDKRLWNHSFDEQAAYDLPNAVDYVLEQTGHEQLVIVGDSSGGALIIMSLVLEPKLNDKLSKAIAWVPSFNIGHKKDNHTYALVQPAFDYIGPFPFTFLSSPFQALMEIACSLEVLQVTLCTLATDTNWGTSAGMAPLRPEFQSNYMTPVSAHEYLQLIQFVSKKQTRMFDFRNKAKNLLAYDREEPPYYNLSLVSFEYLSIYVGTSDTLVNLEDIETVHRELKVPHRIITMGQPGINHGAVLYHDQVARIVIIPTYKDIISHGRRAVQSGRQRAGHRNRRKRVRDSSGQQRF
uniref:Lipase member N n=1 Tax=Aceria tosichella TaxID=561515 RepID=A0A6G1SIQ0_9ACAR